MAIFKCKMCGGALEINGNETVTVCEYCGTKQTLPKLDDDRKANLYDRANHFRRNNEFDKAMGIYEQILNEDNTDAEAYWSLVLCKYGIEYVEDPAAHKRVPTVNRAQFTSVFADEDYKSALKYADAYQRSVYEDEAKAIDEIQKGILEISSKEEPFDVFICYKETDNNGRRTPDSVLATELYHELTREGFKVFFSRITLEDKLGTAYEPYIFAALHSSKVMVVLGTRPEYFNAVWVKNEWNRYLALIKNGAKKMLIPAYKDMDPYDLPEEFSHLQAQDMSKLGFMQDLIRGIKKIVQTDEPKTTTSETVVINSGNANIEPLLKRAFMFLEDGEWQKADDFCEQVLNQDPENVQAYLGKLMAKFRVQKQDDLIYCKMSFEDNNNYKKIVRFGNEELNETLKGYINQINERIENERLEGIYILAKAAMEGKDVPSYESAIRQFESASGWKDSAEQIDICRAKIEELKPIEEAKKLEFERKRKSASKSACMVSARGGHTVGLKSDGTVVAVGYNCSGQCDVSGWKSIVAVSAGSFHTVGLKSDRTAVAVGNNKYGQCDVLEWKDIVAVSVRENNFKGFTVGLKSDGTVVATGWNIDGQCNVSDWKDIVAISAGNDYTVGLKSDGTVVAVGENEYGKCNVSDWRNIVAVSAGNIHTVGLKSDGTVVAVGRNTYDQCNVSDWKDIVAVSAGPNHTVGLKSDGTLIAAGDNYKGQCDVSGWKDIIAISAGTDYTVGLKSDGTVVAVGANYNGECDVTGWKLFDSFDNLEEERRCKVEKLAMKISALESERADLQKELTNLKGLFSGKRRKQIENRLTEIENELKRL